jgi:NAD binding domain of 6-phosphogluconate dehydrogenase
MSTATTPDKPRIGWIGLGKMGLPICERLAAQQFQLTTLIRNSEGRERADRAKLRGDSKIGGVVGGAQIVASAISDDAAARHRLQGRRPKGLRGEVDDINGLVAREQRRLGGRAPVNEKRVENGHRDRKRSANGRSFERRSFAVAAPGLTREQALNS